MAGQVEESQLHDGAGVKHGTKPLLAQMSVDEYAELQRHIGARVCYVGGYYWRQIRPFFYRPLLPYTVIRAAPEARLFSWPKTFQHVVPSVEGSNSRMNFLFTDNSPDYSLAVLSHKRRNLIKCAARQFNVKRICNCHSLHEEAYNLYLSFFRRTGYQYKTDRVNKRAFLNWVESALQHPKSIVLGGFSPEGLIAISCSYWVEDTLIYASLFCETSALRRNIGDLMFHELRSLAAIEPGISSIFIRSYQNGNSIDSYYLARGCRLVQAPAKLVIPSLIDRGLRIFSSQSHDLLIGKSCP